MSLETNKRWIKEWETISGDGRRRWRYYRQSSLRKTRWSYDQCLLLLFGLLPHLESAEWFWISLFHFLLSSTSSSFNPTLIISLFIIIIRQPLCPVVWRRPQHAVSKLPCLVPSSAISCGSSICPGRLSTASLVSLVLFSCHNGLYRPFLFYTSLSTWFSVFLSVSFLVSLSVSVFETIDLAVTVCQLHCCCLSNCQNTTLTVCYSLAVGLSLAGSVCQLCPSCSSSLSHTCQLFWTESQSFSSHQNLCPQRLKSPTFEHRRSLRIFR